MDFDTSLSESQTVDETDGNYEERDMEKSFQKSFQESLSRSMEFFGSLFSRRKSYDATASSDMLTNKAVMIVDYQTDEDEEEFVNIDLVSQSEFAEDIDYDISGQSDDEDGLLNQPTSKNTNTSPLTDDLSYSTDTSTSDDENDENNEHDTSPHDAHQYETTRYELAQDDLAAAVADEETVVIEVVRTEDSSVSIIEEYEYELEINSDGTTEHADYEQDNTNIEDGPPASNSELVESYDGSEYSGTSESSSTSDESEIATQVFRTQDPSESWEDKFAALDDEERSFSQSEVSASLPMIPDDDRSFSTSEVSRSLPIIPELPASEERHAQIEKQHAQIEQADHDSDTSSVCLSIKYDDSQLSADENADAAETVSVDILRTEEKAVNNIDKTTNNSILPDIVTSSEKPKLSFQEVHTTETINKGNNDSAEVLVVIPDAQEVNTKESENVENSDTESFSSVESHEEKSLDLHTNQDNISEDDASGKGVDYSLEPSPKERDDHTNEIKDPNDSSEPVKVELTIDAQKTDSEIDTNGDFEPNEKMTLVVPGTDANGAPFILITDESEDEDENDNDSTKNILTLNDDNEKVVDKDVIVENDNSITYEAKDFEPALSITDASVNSDGTLQDTDATNDYIVIESKPNVVKQEEEKEEDGEKPEEQLPLMPDSNEKFDDITPESSSNVAEANEKSASGIVTNTNEKLRRSVHFKPSIEEDDSSLSDHAKENFNATPQDEKPDSIVNETTNRLFESSEVDADKILSDIEAGNSSDIDCSSVIIEDAQEPAVNCTFSEEDQTNVAVDFNEEEQQTNEKSEETYSHGPEDQNKDEPSNMKFSFENPTNDEDKEAEDKEAEEKRLRLERKEKNKSPIKNQSAEKIKKKKKKKKRKNPFSIFCGCGGSKVDS